jgi:hypothetical protein
MEGRARVDLAERRESSCWIMIAHTSQACDEGEQVGRGGVVCDGIVAKLGRMVFPAKGVASPPRDAARQLGWEAPRRALHSQNQ